MERYFFPYQMFLHTSKKSIHPSCITHTSATMNTKLSDEELLARVHGTEVLPAQLRTRLSQFAAQRQNKRLHWFNSRQGWLLRRVVRNHTVIRTAPKYCALCGSNRGSAILRVKPRSACDKCHVNLCTVPRAEETGQSCFQEWHRSDRLRERIYSSKPAQERNTGPNSPPQQSRAGPSSPPRSKQGGRDTSNPQSEPEQARANSPPRPSRAGPRSAPPPGRASARSPPHPRRTESNSTPQPSRSRASPSPPPRSPPPPTRTKPQAEAQAKRGHRDRSQCRKRAASPGVQQYREREAEIRRFHEQRESVATHAERIVRRWTMKGRGLPGLLRHVGDVLPRNSPAPAVGNLANAGEIEAAYKRARVALHPDRIRRYNPSVLEAEIARLAFAELGNVRNR